MFHLKKKKSSRRIAAKENRQPCQQLRKLINVMSNLNDRASSNTATFLNLIFEAFFFLFWSINQKGPVKKYAKILKTTTQISKERPTAVRLNKLASTALQRVLTVKIKIKS